MSKYVVAIDQGTTSTRCMLFDHHGSIASISQKEHNQIYPQPGWVEHDTLENWQRTQEVCQEALAKARVKPGAIAAIGITNQRATTLVWDRNTGKPFYNAIVWQDTRTKTICDQLAADGGQDRFRRRRGLDFYPTRPRLFWSVH